MIRLENYKLAIKERKVHQKAIKWQDRAIYV
jgi:hypothetical protein